MNDYRYQVGGNLTNDAPSYIVRSADTQLYAALKAGEFCYVLNTRQMGKSSLMVRISHQLQADGYRCAVLDMSVVGSEDLSADQWYKSIATLLWDRFELGNLATLREWWQDLSSLSVSQRLGQFLDRLLLVDCPAEKIVIFIDEIDTILGLGFSVDDFFALIRSCYNQRAYRPEYRRLSFVLLGVATPSDLIQNRQKTPFNIGQAIDLQGFTLQEAQPLTKGFGEGTKDPLAVLAEILNWTEGQPFLTQKLCSLLRSQQQNPDFTALSDQPAAQVSQLVRSQIIKYWETQDEPEHLRTIRDRIDRNRDRIGRMLSIYQQVLAPSSAVPVNDSKEQTELLLSGLLVKQRGVLKVKNKIYAEVFDLDWVKIKLEQLRPYSQTFDAWFASGQQDESRLLRGNALKEAKAWAIGKSLSDEDYRFLASSEEIDRQITHQALEAERVKEITARQNEEKKNSRLQKILISVMGMALTGLVGFVWAIRQQNRALVLRKISAISTTSEALLSAEQDLESLVTAIEATRNLQELNLSVNSHQGNKLTLTDEIAQQTHEALRQAVYKTNQFNAFAGHNGSIRTLSFSSHNNLIASASVDNTAKLWKLDGTLVATLTGHSAPLVTVEFSDDGERLITTSEDNTAKLWQSDGTLLTTLEGHTGPVWCADFSPDGETIVTGSGDKTLKLWRPDGKIIRTFAEQPSAIFEAEFRPDGKAIATANASNNVDIWQLDGRLQTALDRQESRVSALEFSDVGESLLTASENGIVKLWDNAGELLNTIAAHRGEISGLDVSPDGQQIVTGSSDQTVKLWQQDGTLINTYSGHRAQVYDVRFSPDGKTLASAGFDKLIRLWRISHPLTTSLVGHRGPVIDVEFSPDGQTIATGSADTTVRLWSRDGRHLRTIREHQSGVKKIVFSPDAKLLVTTSQDGDVNVWKNSSNPTLFTRLEENEGGVWGADFSPDGELLAISNIDGSVKLWKLDGTLVQKIKGHTAPVWDVTFSSDGERIATVSSDNQTKVWRRDGTELLALVGSGSPFFGVAFSPDGQTLAASSSDNTVSLWNIGDLLDTTTEAEEIDATVLQGHDAPVFDVVYSPDAQAIATVSGDNSLRLWNPDGSAKVVFKKHNASVRNVAFSPDGQMIATASDDKGSSGTGVEYPYI
ncbi:MAG: AAA-like domain-containing protein [Cyanobacteria bacterium J06650_10]